MKKVFITLGPDLSPAPHHPTGFAGGITKTRLFKYIENFTIKKTESFQLKILIFFIFLLKT